MSTEESATKKPKTSRVIGTHNGAFHCDEALAVYLLKQTPTFRGAEVRRSRDPAIWATCDVLVDVGDKYDPELMRFDHHQRGFDGVFGNGFDTKLSSAGLIYKHFGQEIIAGYLNLPVTDPTVELLWLKMYKEFIEALDGIDNGVQQYPADIKPKYRNRTDLSARVGWLNPAWNQSTDSQFVDGQFEKASTLAGEEFMGRLAYYANAWLPARDLVKSDLNTRHIVDKSGRILLFETFCPWKEHLHELEQALNIPEAEKPLYVIYPDETGGNWRIQCVPESPDSFISRKPLPEPWRGMRNEQLSEVSGVSDCVFVHASGFIGGNRTQGGALKMARLALTM